MKRIKEGKREERRREGGSKRGREGGEGLGLEGKTSQDRTRKRVVLAAVAHPFKLETKQGRVLQQPGEAAKEGGGATRLEHHFEWPDEEGGLG